MIAPVADSLRIKIARMSLMLWFWCVKTFYKCLGNIWNPVQLLSLRQESWLIACRLLRLRCVGSLAFCIVSLLSFSSGETWLQTLFLVGGENLSGHCVEMKNHGIYHGLRWQDAGSRLKNSTHCVCSKTPCRIFIGTTLDLGCLPAWNSIQATQLHEVTIGVLCSPLLHYLYCLVDSSPK